MTEEEFLLIQGLQNKRVLEGKIRVNGAKNAVLKIISAAMLFKRELNIDNAPDLLDVRWLLNILEKMGIHSEFNQSNIRILISDTIGDELDFELAKNLRSSVVLSGPTLARLGRVKFPFPGGDKIGLRPIDLFLESFQKMGAEIEEGADSITISAPKGLHGAEIFFRRQSVTATESVMMAAILAEGTTILKNAAMEPEIIHLADFLNLSGANIKGAGTGIIKIKGNPDELLDANTNYIVPSDRIEAGSFLALAAAVGKDLLIERCNHNELEAVLELFAYMGLNFELYNDAIRVHNNKHISEFEMSDFVTHEYPGFPTDMQAPTVAVMTQMSGEAFVFETIFADRFAYIESLRLMGADIVQLDTRNILIKGPRKLSSRVLRSVDIRAGLAYIIAASVAEGESKIENIFHIDRGYAHIEKRLAGVGLDIERVK